MTGLRTPGPTGVSASDEKIDDGTLARTRMPAPGVVGTSPAATSPAPAIDEDTRMLSATAYGEGSGKDVFEEMAAIANVLVRQQKARKYPTISAFIKADKAFAFAAHDGNPRYAKFMAASEEDIEKDTGKKAAVRGARNALSDAPQDYSNGAFFWDGADIKSNYDGHAKVRAGIHFSDSSHNIYDIQNKDVPGEEWWRDAHGKKSTLRGRWRYKFESTAAHGGTIFWKYSADFLKATGNKEYD